MQEQMSYTTYEGKPTYKLMDIFISSLMSPNIHTRDYVYFRQHKIKAEDSWLRLGQYSYLGSFYQIAKILSRNEVGRKDPGAVYSMMIYL